MKQNKKLFILTGLITLVPVLAGLLLWDRLPEQMPVHWNMEGQIDGWAGKGYVVFGLCGLMVAVHVLCSFITFADPKNKGHNEKNAWMMFWITPLISNLSGALVYSTALGYEIRVERVLPVVMGGMFAVIGNFMPKFKQNSTIGIKIPWTLHDEENWTATHRFAGRVWLVGGIVVMVTGFLGSVWIMIGALMVISILPMIYSYRFYKKKYG